MELIWKWLGWRDILAAFLFGDVDVVMSYSNSSFQHRPQFEMMCKSLSFIISAPTSVRNDVQEPLIHHFSTGHSLK